MVVLCPTGRLSSPASCTIRKLKAVTRPLTSSFPFQSQSGYLTGFVKQRCLHLFPLSVFGLHRTEQQLPISQGSQQPRAVPAASCSNPLRVSEKHP